MAKITEFAKIHQPNSTEKMIANYSTGMIDISKYDRARTIRRINLNYESSSDITVRVYADGYTDTNQVMQSTFPANNSSGPRIVSLRPQSGARAKAIVVKIEFGNVSALGTIRKIEVEIDE